MHANTQRSKVTQTQLYPHKHTFIHAYILLCIKNINTRAHAYTYIYTRTQRHANTQRSKIYTCTHACIHTDMYNNCTHAYTCIHFHIHVHINKHTYTPRLFLTYKKINKEWWERENLSLIAQRNAYSYHILP